MYATAQFQIPKLITNNFYSMWSLEHVFKHGHCVGTRLCYDDDVWVIDFQEVVNEWRMMYFLFLRPFWWKAEKPPSFIHILPTVSFVLRTNLNPTSTTKAIIIIFVHTTQSTLSHIHTQSHTLNLPPTNITTSSYSFSFHGSIGSRGQS